MLVVSGTSTGNLHAPFRAEALVGRACAASTPGRPPAWPAVPHRHVRQQVGQGSAVLTALNYERAARPGCMGLGRFERLRKAGEFERSGQFERVAVKIRLAAREWPPRQRLQTGGGRGDGGASHTGARSATPSRRGSERRADWACCRRLRRQSKETVGRMRAMTAATSGGKKEVGLGRPCRPTKLRLVCDGACFRVRRSHGHLAAVPLHGGGTQGCKAALHSRDADPRFRVGLYRAHRPPVRLGAPVPRPQGRACGRASLADMQRGRANTGPLRFSQDRGDVRGCSRGEWQRGHKRSACGVGGGGASCTEMWSGRRWCFAV